MSVDWGAVAASGTDPRRLERVVGLASTPMGRALLRAPVTGRHGAQRLPDDEGRRAAEVAARHWVAAGVRVSLPGDPSWPTRLDRLASPPLLLAVRGGLPARDRAAVAIVGARRASGYGTGVAAWLAASAAEAGATVVSGGARGVDAAAHLASVAAGTTVVLGCGHAVPYPREHARAGGLFDDVLDGGGGLLSEQLPDVRPHPGVVRARNRIVAALADVVVVVEGGERSGALLTATAAAELGVDVLAVPGDVRAPGSVAPHRLLREGAAPCSGPDDLLAALGAARPRLGSSTPGHLAEGSVAGRVSTEPPGDRVSVLPDELRAELARRWPRPVHVGPLATTAGLPIGRVLAAVTRGLVAGELTESAEGVRLRRSPPTG